MRINKTRYQTREIVSWLWTRTRGCRTQAAANVVLGLMQVGFGLLGVEILRQLTDIATGKLVGSLLLMAGMYGGMKVLEFLCSISHTWISAVLGVKTQNQMQQQFFARILHGKWSGTERFHSGDIINRLFGDVGDIVGLMTEVLPFIITLIVQFAASFIYLYSINRPLALIVIVSSPVFMLLSRLYFYKMRRIVRKVKDSNSSVQSLIQESIQHKMIIKVMEMADEMIGKLEQQQSLLRWKIKTRARFSILTRTIVFIGFRGGALVALTYGLMQVKDGLATVGVLMAFTQLISRIQHPLIELGRLLPTLVNSLASSERLMEIDETSYENEDENKTSHENENECYGIRFENVTYAYGNGKKVVREFNHTFEPGSFTAVLGETGCGKTTLLRMMLALVEPQEGRVVLVGADGTEREVSVSARRLFSYVPQGNSLFSGTIRDNLRIGKADATTEEMMAALKVAQAGFVDELPRKLDTKCSEQGGGLSEGQAQRIAIARALLRPCQILLLDEVTSALDVETEKAVLEGIKEQMKGKTVVFVTHRKEAVDNSQLCIMN